MNHWQLFISICNKVFLTTTGMDRRDVEDIDLMDYYDDSFDESEMYDAALELANDWLYDNNLQD